MPISLSSQKGRFGAKKRNISFAYRGGSYRKRYRYKKGSTQRLIRKVLYNEAETKYISQTINCTFAGNGNSTTGGEGYTVIALTVPPTNANNGGRIGLKITYTGVYATMRVQLNPQANTNYTLNGTIMLVQYINGGATFPMANFLVQNPNTVSYTNNSLRMIEDYKDFRVLARQDVRIGADNYVGNTNAKNIVVSWKGRLKQEIISGGSTPSNNSLFLVFLADSGYLTGTSNFLFAEGNMNIYYKDI